jgi:hypothetical protein
MEPARKRGICYLHVCNPKSGNATIFENIIYNDCRPINQAFRKASTNNKINEWVLRLQGFDFEIYRVPGKNNILADVLSRVPRKLLLMMGKEKERVMCDFHNKNSVVKDCAIDDGDRYKMCEDWISAILKVNWDGWRNALARFMETGTFSRNLTEGEKRSIKTLSKDYRLQEV